MVPTTPSLGSINLLGQLTELRGTFYSLDHWFLIKGYNSVSQMEEMHRARCEERVQSFHTLPGLSTLPTSPHVHQPGSSLNPVLLGVYTGFVTQARSIKSLAIGDGFNFQLPSPPLISGSGTESSNPLIKKLVPLAANPHS